MGEQLLETAWQTLNSPDWKLEKKLDNGDMVQVKTVKGKKLFKLTGYVRMSPRQLLEELFYKIEEVPSWNPTLTDCRIIQPIDQFTDISYQVSQSVRQSGPESPDILLFRFVPRPLAGWSPPGTSSTCATGPSWRAECSCLLAGV